MTSRENEPQTEGPSPAGAAPPGRDAFAAVLEAALSAAGALGTRIAEGRAEYAAGGEWPLPRLRTLVGDARAALERAGPDQPASGLAAAVEALDRLGRLAATRHHQAAALARRLYGDTESLAEDTFLARCLVRHPTSALEMAAMRRYLRDAAVPADQADLCMDRMTSLEQVSFAALWAEPYRLDGIRATFEHFRRRYVASYRQQHALHRRALARLAQEIEDAQARALALVRLNTLEGLGRPLGREAVAELAGLARVGPCPREEAPDGLASPACDCGFVLGEVAPWERVEEAVRRVGRALSQQMARLSGHAVRRILALPARGRDDDRLARFLQVVQASDVGGLVNVLDDELVAFLGDLLAAGPPPEAGPVLQQLMRSFPVVGPGEVDSAATEFRRLLREALDQARRASPRRSPVVRLAPAPARRHRG